MKKKIFAAAVIAGVIALSGGSAAFAGETEYPPSIGCTANPATIAPGATSTVTCTFPEGMEGWNLHISVTGPGVTDATLTAPVASVLAAATGTDTYDTTITGLTAAVRFTGPNVTSSTPYAVSATATEPEGDGEVSGSATVTVTPGSTGGLPATGGTVPAAVIWLGVGAVGIGGVAVAAAVARRRASNR